MGVTGSDQREGLSHMLVAGLLLLLLTLVPQPPPISDLRKSPYSDLIQDPFQELFHPQIRWMSPLSLVPHENTSAPHLEALIQHLLVLPLDAQVPIPVVTQTKPRVILDGHHRVAASIRLEIDRIPCWVVDDSDEVEHWDETRIRVYTRLDGQRIALHHVVSSAREGRVAFGIKGTRHVALIGPDRAELPLERVTPRVSWGQWVSGGRDFLEGGHPVLVVD